VLQAKSNNGVVVKSENPVGGLKAAARRMVFADVSNKVATSKTTAGKEAKGGVIIVQENVSQKTRAISKPAQRASGTKNASVTTQQAIPSQKAGPRRMPRRTTVYEDKKPSPRRQSPKKASPKVSRDAISKRDSQLAAIRQNGLRNQAPPRPLSRVKHQDIKEDEPVYSDQQPHLFDEDYVDYEDENGAEVDDDDDDATDGEDDEPRLDEKARFNADVEAVSDYEVDISDDDESDYATARSRAGDNTTGVTTQVLVPRWTSKARKEISKLNEEYATLQDEDEEADISMVAEYGDEIFEYMRELEVKNSTSDGFCLALTSTPEEVDSKCTIHGLPI